MSAEKYDTQLFEQYSLNQIGVRVSTIYTSQLAHSSCPIHHLTSFQNLVHESASTLNWRYGSEQHLYASRCPTFEHIIYRMIGNETQVFTSWLHTTRLRLELLTGEMEVELLVAKCEGVSGMRLSTMHNSSARKYMRT